MALAPALSVVGALAGIAVFGTVRVLGWIWKRQEAMGLGDVILARAMGAMLVSVVPAGSNPARLIPIWVLLSCGSGAVIGIAQLRWRSKNAANVELTESRGAGSIDPDSDAEEPPEDESSLKQELVDIAYVLCLLDVYEYIHDVLSRKNGETVYSSAR